MSDTTTKKRVTATKVKIKKPTKVYRPTPKRITKSIIAKKIQDVRQESAHYKRQHNRSIQSFKESSIYRDHENNYYDEQENNVEQDPIQASLSKEIIDPELSDEEIGDEFEDGPDEEKDLFDSSYSD